MACIKRFEVFAVDLPLKKPFVYAEEERSVSGSIFVKCITDSGTVGFGESLPRQAVTGESRDYSYELLRDSILPHLIDKEFKTFEDVRQYLYRCDGKAPSLFPDAHLPQNSSWCAAELSLLDAFGREFSESLFSHVNKRAKRMHRYSGIITSEQGIKFFSAAMKMLVYGFPAVKVVVGKTVDIEALKGLKNLLGNNVEIRVDAEMSWDRETALVMMKAMAGIGIHCFEQPLAKDDIEGLARLIDETKEVIMADESFTDRGSLDSLVAQNACKAVNVRISKCGGLIASQRLILEALAAGLTIQVGAYVGESSLLSAAHVALITQFSEIKYVEGCLGTYALKEDPVSPLMQFRYGGKLPVIPKGYGLGITVDEEILRRYTLNFDVIS
jgi:L-Ala-D/L-Glu epimerase